MKIKTKPNIYISGPITGIANYQDNFSECEYYLRDEGIYNPVNPVKQSIRVLEACNVKPLQSEFRLLQNIFNYEDWIKAGLILMMQNNCQDIILLNRWQYSTGACNELLYAKFFGYKIHLYFENIKNGNKRVELKNNYRNKY